MTERGAPSHKGTVAKGLKLTPNGTDRESERTTSVLTAAALRSQLWNCADILRGSAVDRTDWKAYILPLLFFKRLCDVWDEETAEAVIAFGEADPALCPEAHRFQLPNGCHWRDVRAAAANVGAVLAHAMREIERANPESLYRVFGAADWGGVNWTGTAGRAAAGGLAQASPGVGCRPSSGGTAGAGRVGPGRIVRRDGD